MLALRCATYNAAYRLQRADLGLVAAGRRADIVVLDDLVDFVAAHVLFDGALVASQGKMVVDVVEGPSDPPFDTMHLAHLEPADMLLRLDVPDGWHRMRVIADSVMTRWDESDVSVIDGFVDPPDGDIIQVTVHRHGRITPVPYSALLSGWGNWTGAIATTVAHDTHNLVVFGRDPRDMALAANTVIDSGGGLAVTRSGEVLASIALPIAGILSPLPAADCRGRAEDSSGRGDRDRAVRADAQPAALPGNAVVARVPARSARDRCRAHRRHHGRDRGDRAYCLATFDG